MKGLEAKTLGLRKVIRHEYKRIVAFMLTAPCSLSTPTMVSRLLAMPLI